LRLQADNAKTEGQVLKAVKATGFIKS